jgi:hypothetical protein
MRIIYVTIIGLFLTGSAFGSQDATVTVDASSPEATADCTISAESGTLKSGSNATSDQDSDISYDETNTYTATYAGNSDLPGLVLPAPAGDTLETCAQITGVTWNDDTAAISESALTDGTIESTFTYNPTGLTAEGSFTVGDENDHTPTFGIDNCVLNTSMHSQDSQVTVTRYVERTCVDE